MSCHKYYSYILFSTRPQIVQKLGCVVVHTELAIKKVQSAIDYYSKCLILNNWYHTAVPGVTIESALKRTPNPPRKVLYVPRLEVLEEVLALEDVSVFRSTVHHTTWKKKKKKGGEKPKVSISIAIAPSRSRDKKKKKGLAHHTHERKYQTAGEVAHFLAIIFSFHRADALPNSADR